MLVVVASWSAVSIGDAVLEVLVRGAGDPVLLIQTALSADELLPLADRLAADVTTVVTHRRGYAGSSPAPGPGSIRRDAADCAALLSALGLQRVHVVGASYSAAVAMELAARWPHLVHTLCLVEPPPLHVPAAGEFRAANAELLEMYRAQGPGPTLEAFMARLMGPGWRTALEHVLPGAVAATERDAATFLEGDVPALWTWEFGTDDAARIDQPVLYVGGTDSGPWFAQVRSLVADWFPQAEDVQISGAGHSVVLTHAPQVAAVVREFLRRYRLPPAAGPPAVRPPSGG